MTLPGIVTGSRQLRWLLILLVFVFGSPSRANGTYLSQNHRHPGAGRDPVAPSVASFPGLFASLTLRAALWAFNALRAFVRPAPE